MTEKPQEPSRLAADSDADNPATMSRRRAVKGALSLLSVSMGILLSERSGDAKEEDIEDSKKSKGRGTTKDILISKAKTADKRYKDVDKFIHGRKNKQPDQRKPFGGVKK